MPTYVVRVWLPDRPGALGSVAGRIGAVGGDLVAIDILERGAGRAIDELVVELPDVDRVDLLVKELREVDGVDVEDVRKVSDAGRSDPRLAALETAAEMVAQRTLTDVLRVLVERAASEFEAGWVAVADVEHGDLVARTDEAPPATWILAFAAGVTETADTGDVAWAPLAAMGLALVLGRPGRVLRALERRQLVALAVIADTRLAELARKTAFGGHSSAI